MRAGVEHILLTEHLDMTRSPTEPDMDEQAEALDTAIGRLQETTKSIGGRCSTPPPASFGLTEPVPPGACAILVAEDFLDVPLGTRQVWLDSLYVAVAAPATSNSSVLILQVDGRMWITNSVFQGAGSNSRAISMTTANYGHPEMFVQGTTITGFVRDLAPGVVVWHNASLVLDDVAFKNLQLLPRATEPHVQAASVALFPGAGILMQDVTFENNAVHGEPAGPREVATAKGSGAQGPPAVAFSVPKFLVWTWPGGPPAMTDSIDNSSKFAAGFLDGDAVLSGIQAERRLLVEQNLGAMPPLEDSTPPAIATRAPRRSPGIHVSVVPDADTPDDAMQPPVPPRPPHPPPPALSLWPQQSPSAPLPLPPLPRQDDLDTKPRSGDPSTSALPVASGAATEISSTADEIVTEGDEDDDDKGGVPARLVVVCSMASVAAVALGITAVMLVMLWRQQQDQQEQEQEQKQLHQLHQLHQPRDMAELRVAVTKWTEGSQEGEEAPQAAVTLWPDYFYTGPSGYRGPR